MSKIVPTLAALVVFTVAGPQTFAGEPPAQSFSMKSLGKMLDAMGYSYETCENEQGEITQYDLVLKRGRERINCYLRPSGNGQYLWINNHLLTFGTKRKATAPVLLGFIEQQNNIWPSQIVYFRKSGRLTLAHAVKTKSLSPAALRDGFDSMMNSFITVADAYEKVRPKNVTVAKPVTNE